jgi:hypothetical protein
MTTTSDRILRNMAEAAALTIIEKMERDGMTHKQAIAYITTHEQEVADFAIRLVEAYHLEADRQELTP